MSFVTFCYDPELSELYKSFPSILENESVMVSEMAMNVDRYNEYFCWSHSGNSAKASSSDPDSIASLIAESLNSFTFLQTFRKCSLCGSPWG